MAPRRTREAAADALDARALRQRAIRLLARRDRSRAEMEQLLAPYCADPAALAAMLDELQRLGWLSEARLAAQVVHSRRKRAGALRIRQHLALRGVPHEVIAAATVGLEATDFAAALELWRRRFGTPAADRAQRERQLRFLLSRGFDRGIALKVVRSADEQEPV